MLCLRWRVRQIINPRQQKVDGKPAQPPTREESILRDVVIEHMKGSGLDVIGAEEGQRVLDMANDEDVRTGRVTIVLLTTRMRLTCARRCYLRMGKR